MTEEEYKTKQFKICPLTMAKVFAPAGLTNISDLQAVFDAVEAALSRPVQEPVALPSGRTLTGYDLCSARAISDGSTAQMMYFIEDAKKDIAYLTRRAAPRPAHGTSATERVAAGQGVEVKPLEPNLRYEWDGMAGKMRYFGSSAPNGWLGDEKADDVSVKPLEWFEHPNAFPAPTWSAQTGFGFYNIEEVSASDSPAYEVRLHAHRLVSVNDSLDEAKAAAQADYERRILSALATPTPKEESK